MRIVDVVGCIQDAYATLDSHGNKVNDPWSTPYASSGFDLAGVGVIHHLPTRINDAFAAGLAMRVFPNPAQHHARLHYTLPASGHVRLTIRNAMGHTLHTALDAPGKAGMQAYPLDLSNLPAGLYFVWLTIAEGRCSLPFIVQ